MNFLKSLWNSFMSIFRSNQIIMQIAVQEAAMSAFKNRPQLKPVVAKLAGVAMDAVRNGTPANLTTLSAMLKSRVDMSTLPPEQRLVFGPIVDQMIDELSLAVQAYLTSQGFTTPSTQTATILMVLGWISDMAKA